MNLYQCEERAREIGYDKARFFALFPVGPMQCHQLIPCRWLDAYMGLFVIEVDGLRDGFVTTREIDREFPDLFCSESYVPDEV